MCFVPEYFYHAARVLDPVSFFSSSQKRTTLYLKRLSFSPPSFLFIFHLTQEDEVLSRLHLGRFGRGSSWTMGRWKAESMGTGFVDKRHRWPMVQLRRNRCPNSASGLVI